MKSRAYIILAVLLLLPFMAAPVHAGVTKNVIKVGREMVERGVKYIVKSATREASEEVSESAARKLVREAIQHSDDVAKIAKEFGEEGLMTIVKSPAARTLCQEAGEDATIAILKHGNLGVELMSKAPKKVLPDMAATLSSMEKSTARRLTSTIRELGDKAGDAIAWATRHPKIAAAGAVGAYILATPSLRTTLATAIEHPYATATILLILATLIWYIWTHLTPLLLSKLLKLFRKKTAN